MRMLCWLAAALGPLWLATELPAQPAVRVGAPVVRELARSGAVEVVVMLAEPTAIAPRSLRFHTRAVAARRQAVLAAVSPEHVQVHRRFAMIGGFTATVSSTGLAQLLAQADVARVDTLTRGTAALAQSVPQIRADVVHRRDDLGSGVTVAVLDAGLDATHPDLDGSIVAEHCFCRPHCCPNGADEQSGSGSAFSPFVHGTHVTGVIVSKGIVAPIGVAPAAKVVAVKVLNDAGSGLLVDWIAGLDFIATSRPDVQAVNMSLVSDLEYGGACDTANDASVMALAREMRMLRNRGVLTFAAAGNKGHPTSMAAPACASAAVSVAAVDKADVLWPSSNRSAMLDLLAPGVDIVSAGTDHKTDTISGTSIATPHATGTAALLLALNPTLSPDTLEGILKDGGVPIHDPDSGRIFPRVNALAGMNATWRITQPLLGGGSKHTDCIVAWNVLTPAASPRPQVTGLTCHDGDAACDTDQTPGQCSFQVAPCFNIADARLPRCAHDAAIVSYTLSAPNMKLDPTNAATLGAALPPLPIVDGRCADPVPFVVPTGGVRWIRFAARTGDGRRDYDRLRFTCLPAAP